MTPVQGPASVCAANYPRTLLPSDIFAHPYHHFLAPLVILWLVAIRGRITLRITTQFKSPIVSPGPRSTVKLMYSPLATSSSAIRRFA